MVNDSAEGVKVSVIKTYRFRLYPTEQQSKIMNETIETCRHLYNDSLGERHVDWDVHYWDQISLLPLRKQDNKFYQQVHSQVLQDVLLRLDKSYQAFFKKLAKYPKFKRRGQYNSFTYPQYFGYPHGGFRLKNNKLVLPRIGSIEIKLHRIPIGKLKQCTIMCDVDQWFCCIIADDGVVSVELNSSVNAVGVDVGLLNWIMLSDGKEIQNLIDFNAQIKKIKHLQRSLSRKKKGSRNREKARISLAKAWRKVRRTRDDFVHKTSRIIADTYTLIVFEKLTINNMVKNHSLAKAIMDATWGKLRLYTAYKVERRGGRVIVVNPCGTSQKCSCCGEVVKKDLSIRTHECPNCKLVLDRDHNAARNILKLGLEQAHAEKQSILVRQRISKFASKKHEIHRE